MVTAPDPPESSSVEARGDGEEIIPTLRRLSTACSQDPPQAPNAPEPPQAQVRGQDPDEYQIISSSPNEKGALVLYNHEAPTPSESTSQETEEKAETTGNELVVKPSPTESMTKDMRFGFDHCYVTVPCKERLSVLFATLRRSSDRKVIVICSTWETASYYAVLFRQLEMLHVYEMHEHMKDVAHAYEEFLYLYPGILFASDIAMREFDIPPNVDYIIQYEPPMNPTEYIYRMSNAKIYRTSCHKSLLFLSPGEMHFLEYFDHIPNKELEARKVSEFQGSVEKLVSKHRELNDLAWTAFRAFMIAYESHSHSDIYDRAQIDEDGIRRSFGQPHIDIPEYSSKKNENINGAAQAKKEDAEGDAERPKDNQLKKHQWMNKEKTTWRKGGQPWTTRENRTWRHSDVHKWLFWLNTTVGECAVFLFVVKLVNFQHKYYI